MLVRALFLALMASVLTAQAQAQAQAQDPIAGDYRIDNQNDVFITRVSDVPNTYFVTIFTVSDVNGVKKACDFQEEMKLSSRGLVFANITCQVGVSKDSPTTVKVVGSCPSSCQPGASIAKEGFEKAADTDPMIQADEYIGD